MSNDYATVEAKPLWARRWWISTRECSPVLYANGLVGACHEFYVPLWAWPLELIHKVIFGSTKIEG